MGRGAVGPQREDLEAVLERERARAHCGLYGAPAADQLGPVVDTYCDDVLQRILPGFAALRPDDRAR